MKAIRSPGRTGASVTSAAQYAAYAIGCCLSICACTHTSQIKAESHRSLEKHSEKQAEEKTVETVRTGPETITVTVEEYEVAPGPSVPTESAAAHVSTRNQAAAARPAAGAESAAAPLILVKRTVTVDQRGPVLDVKRADDTQAVKEASTETLDAKTATKTKTAPALAGWLYVALAVGALVVVGGTAWRLTPWSRVIGAIKALF